MQTGHVLPKMAPEGARRFKMKRLIALAVAVAVLGIGIGPTFAAVDRPTVPPKGIEGPDIR